MKKLLLGTSAMAVAGALATAANAAEWEVRVGGYMEQHVGVAFSDVDNVSGEQYDGVDVKSDAEIFFLPSITLDNGLRFGANIQLEANTSGDQIDESYMFIRGSWGEVNLGSENSAGYKMSYGAPDVTFFGVNSGSGTAFIPYSGTAAGRTTGSDIFRGTLGSTFLENARNNDALRITYYTPRYAGFQVGVSYARDGLDDSNAQVNCDSGTGGAANCNFFDVGANYVNSFGDFDVAVSSRWGIGFDDRTGVAGTDIGRNPQVWGAGLNLGYAGFTIGGSFAEQNNSGNDDGRAFDAGVSYETGPWGFSFTYFNGENVDDENQFNPLGNDEDLQQFMVGINYALARGVYLGAYGLYVDFEEDRGDGGGVRGDDVDGFIIGTGIRIRF